MNRDEEFKKEIDAAQKAFAKAYKLLEQGKRSEAKQIEKEGDAHYKRARAILKEKKQGR
jgi:hypothetical protein